MTIRNKGFKLSCILAVALSLSACSLLQKQSPENTAPVHTEIPKPTHSASAQPASPSPSPDNTASTDAGATSNSTPEPSPSNSNSGNKAIEVVTEPQNITVLVNKQYALPDQYAPEDLVYPDVHYIFSEKLEKRMLRKEAATALEALFGEASKSGIYLGGVSGYRSNQTQAALFNRYVERDGLEKAKTYSAVPGHSEHETGLAIDVSGSDGKCAAQDCFANTEEALWLADHSHEFGFIIRYPEGKEKITGYQYEPWHLRYVGEELAKELYENDWTLEEYYNVIPVTE